MFVIAKTQNDVYTVPADAILTIVSPNGCAVYMPGDEIPVFNVLEETHNVLDN